jgi:hypothetical protein
MQVVIFQTNPTILSFEFSYYRIETVINPGPSVVPLRKRIKTQINKN